MTDDAGSMKLVRSWQPAVSPRADVVGYSRLMRADEEGSE